MSWDMNYLNTVNRTIGEHARFARSFMAGLESGTIGTGAADGATGGAGMPTGGMGEMDAMGSMMMLMLMQMMQTMASMQGANGQNLMPSNWNVPLNVLNNMNQQSAADNGGAAANTNPGATTQQQNSSGTAGDGAPVASNPVPGFLKEMLETGGTAGDQSVSVQNGLQSGAFTTSQLTQTLKVMMESAPDAELPPVKKLVTQLIDGGTVAAESFMNDEYLGQLSAARREALLETLGKAGLQLDSYKINTRLSGVILQTLNQSRLPNTQAFTRDLLQRYHDNLKGNLAETDEGEALSSIYLLGGITVGEDGKLVFP